MYATHFPSGDQTGFCSCTVSEVSRLGVPFGKSSVYSRSSAENSEALPVGREGRVANLLQQDFTGIHLELELDEGAHLEMDPCREGDLGLAYRLQPRPCRSCRSRHSPRERLSGVKDDPGSRSRVKRDSMSSRCIG